jgi:tetratricopeptide (TPR) repeat protein
MLTDADVLARVKEALQPSDLSAAIMRLRRVPEVWRALHAVDFLGYVMEHPEEITWTPGAIADCCLLYNQSHPTKTEGEVRDQSAQALADLFDLAMATHDLAKKINSSPEDVVYEFQAKPMAWSSQLCCVWPLIDQPASLIEQILNLQDRLTTRLLLSALRANYATTDLIDVLQGNSHYLSHYIPELVKVGEKELVLFIADQLADPSGSLNGEAESQHTQMYAYAQAVGGNYEGAHASLSAAWNAATESTASVADRLADVARLEGNKAVELEARRQAMDKATTPIRRAALARSLVENNQPYDACQLVAKAEGTEERIAYGMAALQQGLQTEAITALTQAKTEAIQLEFSDTEWLGWMAEGLRACGSFSDTIETKTYMSSILPHDATLELELAELWEQAGDPSTAVIHAEIALAISPGSAEARKLLAHNLRLQGEVDQALGFFKQVVEQDKDARFEYCECALEAHQSELASEIAATLVEENPDSAQAQMLLAGAKQLQGEHELAHSAIARAIELSPSEVEPRLVLADLQSASGEFDAAGETLLQAIQIAPQSGKAHFARAQWLAAQDRFHEASEYSAKAIDLDPINTSWMVDHAQLLAKKGDQKGARTQLEQALALQPMNWSVRYSLALILEGSGDLEKAVELVSAPPTELDSSSSIDVGRILIKSGVCGDSDAVKKGIDLLNVAQVDPEKNADHLYWSARANEVLGNHATSANFYEKYLGEYEHLPEHHTLDAVLGYSRVSLAQAKPDQAIAFLQANRDKFPASMEVVQLLAEAHLANGNGQQAHKIAEEAIELNPASIDARRLLSKTAEALGDVRSAIDAEQEILAQQPDNGANWQRIAKLYSVIKDISAARTHLARAIQIDRRDADSLHRLANLSGDFGLPDTRIRLMKRAGSMTPDNVTIQRDLAEISEQSGDFDTAFTAWMRCVNENPNDPKLVKRAARAVSKAGRIPTAIELWMQALELNPEDIESLMALAEAYEMQGDPQASLHYYQQLLDLDAKDPEILTAIARAHMHYGDRGKAQSLFERTLNYSPDHVGIQLVQIEAALQSGDGQKALAIAESVITQTPPDAYTLGLAALSAIMVGDVQRAKAGLDEALHEAHLPSRATQVLINVSAALGEWRVHSALLSGMNEITTGSNALERTALRVVLRARDLEWIHSQLLNVRANKPDVEFINQYLQTKLVDRSKMIQSDEHYLEPYIHWHALHEAPTAALESHLDRLSHAEKQEFVQAAVIGFLKANRPSKALSLLDEYTPSGIYQAYHALLTSIACMHTDQTARAKDSAEFAARSIETRACASYIQGKQASNASEVEEAITAFNAALAIWPDESVWHAELARIYALSDRHEAALPHLQQAVELDPHSTDHLIALGRAYRSSGEWSQAEVIYARCLQDNPSSAQVWKEAGEVALSNGNASQAESWFERACSLAPSDAVCLIGSARAALQMGQNKNAIERAQSAYKLAPNEPQVLTGFGDILSNQGKTEKAIQAYDRAIKISAGDPQIQLARSRLLLKSGQYTDAINDIRNVINTTHEDPAAWELLADAYECGSQLDEALIAINRALEIAPRSGAYRLAQGRIYRKVGQLDQALKVLRALELDEPENGNLPGELGKVYEARRETDAALEAYLRAVALNEQDIDSCMQAGLILKGIKSYEHAAEMFERVVTSRPNDAKALHQLAAVRALQLVHGGIETQVVTT